MAKGMDNTQILAVVTAEIDAASGFSSGELANDRADAMDYYLGEPYGDEVDGRSQYRSREVLETIQNLLPSLMRIFGEAENLVVFDPVGPEDVAEQDGCSHGQHRGRPEGSRRVPAPVRAGAGAVGPGRDRRA